MKLLVGAASGAAATLAADLVEQHATAAISARGRFVLALSGGRGPVPFFEQLATRDIEWGATWVLQVDERLAPDGDPARNAVLLTGTLGGVLSRAGGFVAVPVDPVDPAATVAAHRATLLEVAGDPPVIDLVHLGLGADGHTASLVPGDPVVDVIDEPVALTGEYEGHRRSTLTRPVLDGARHRLWFVVGEGKQRALGRLLHHDHRVPAGLVRSEGTTVVVDRAALGLVPPGRQGARSPRPGTSSVWPRDPVRPHHP